MSKFTIKDSGARTEFNSGMVRDIDDDKIGWHKVLEGPLLKRWAEHLTKGAQKYPDLPDGTANWTLAKGEKEFVRFRQSLARHFMQFMNGDTDEDHAAAIVFNLNGMLYTQMRMSHTKKPKRKV